MARELVGADRCSIWLIDAKHHCLWTKVAHGVEETHIPIGRGLFPDVNRVRRIDTIGIITTIAGTGQPGFSGDQGAATSAALRFDSAGTSTSRIPTTAGSAE